MDAGGRVTASGTDEHQPFASPQPGWAEQDPGDWWRACGIAVKKALQKSGVRGEEIACVGFSGQMHGAVLLDAAGEVVRPALIWCDQRTEKQARELSEKFGTDRLIQLYPEGFFYDSALRIALETVVGGAVIFTAAMATLRVMER